MATDWLEFTLNVVGGSTAFLCLFEGVLRMGRNGVSRGPLLTALLGFSFFAAFSAFAFWKYSDANDTLASRVVPRLAAQAPADATRARTSFISSGLLASYVERGEKKSYQPSQDDIRRRERAVATNTLLVATARASLYESVMWLVLAAFAVVSGFLFSRPKVPAA